MLNQSNILKIISSNIAAKIIDGEVILINLRNGIYYSMSGVAAEVLALIEQGLPVCDIINTLTDHYSDNSEAKDDIECLIKKLLDEKIVEELPGKRNEQPVSLPVLGMIYQTPKLEIYTDMGDLLALDPPMPGLVEAPWK